MKLSLENINIIKCHECYKPFRFLHRHNWLLTLSTIISLFHCFAEEILSPSLGNFDPSSPCQRWYLDQDHPYHGATGQPILTDPIALLHSANFPHLHPSCFSRAPASQAHPSVRHHEVTEPVLHVSCRASTEPGG